MSMANVTKTTRIQAIAELQKRKTEIQNRLQNGQSQDSTTIGGNSFTEDEWKKIIQKMDEYLTEVKQEQKERFEKRDKEKEIQQFYEKMKMAERFRFTRHLPTYSTIQSMQQTVSVCVTQEIFTED